MSEPDRCYPKERTAQRMLTATPYQTICFCGRVIEQDEKGTWRHV